jgi:GTP pyrophosphokinase
MSDTGKLQYFKGFCKGKGFNKTLKAINIASVAHSDMQRKGGGPFIMHPIQVSYSLSILGVLDDSTLAAAILHDVPEDCPEYPLEVLKERYGVSEEVLGLISLLTKKDEQTLEEYYRLIRTNIKAILIKASDRAHNVSSMSGVFTKEKIKSYIKESRDHVLPTCKWGILHYPEYSEPLYCLRDGIVNVIDAIEITMNSYEQEIA